MATWRKFLSSCMPLQAFTISEHYLKHIPDDRSESLLSTIYSTRPLERMIGMAKKKIRSRVAPAANASSALIYSASSRYLRGVLVQKPQCESQLNCRVADGVSVELFNPKAASANDYTGLQDKIIDYWKRTLPNDTDSVDPQIVVGDQVLFGGNLYSWRNRTKRSSRISLKSVFLWIGMPKKEKRLPNSWSGWNTLQRYL